MTVTSRTRLKLRETARARLEHAVGGHDNALLSVFRHFDSASVNKGLMGDVPHSMWLFDFPLLERTYYQLAVNFDVYGHVSPQAQTRLCFDQIVQRWGIRRTHPLFWTYFHDLNRYLQEAEPREAAVLDMNRYENL